MARKSNDRNTKTSVSAPVKQHTAKEIEAYSAKHNKYSEETMLKNFEEAMKGLTTIRDVSKNSVTSVNSFNKEVVINYLRNIGSNEVNLRNVSRYLFYRCHPYYRLIMYNSTMFELGIRSIIPQYSMTEELNPDDIISSYEETAKVLDVMNLQYQFLKAYTVCFREDVFYGCAYYDETGWFIYPLDPDYCIISGIYDDGSFAFHMDMSYFRSRQTLLEFLGSPFKEMYRAYESKGEKYQPMPDDRCVCLKARPEDLNVIIPIYSGLLISIINLLDQELYQAVADEASIYKMVWLEMETLNTDLPNDWKISPQIYMEYFNRMLSDCLPDYISAAIVPGKINEVSFPSDAASDTSKVAESTATLFNTSGGSQILNSKTITGTTAFTAAIKADTELAISNLLPQTEGIVNRLLKFYIGDKACHVKFHEVSAYTKDEFKKTVLESCANGLPNKLLYNTMNGFSELQTLALNNFEENILGLTEKLVPLQTSYTRSRTDGTIGRPTSDTVTDDGEASREKSDRANE